MPGLPVLLNSPDTVLLGMNGNFPFGWLCLPNLLLQKRQSQSKQTNKDNTIDQPKIPKA